MNFDHVDLALLLLRVTVGVMIFAHGYNHVFRGGKIAGTGRWFESLGMAPGALHAWFASATELVVGPMLVAGFLTSLAAAGVVGVLVVAWIVNHVKNGFFIFRPSEGWEYVGVMSFVALAIGTMGPGSWSVDDAIGFELNGTVSLGATLLGVLAAAGLLFVFWRPDDTKRPKPWMVGAVFGAFVVAGVAGLAMIGDGFDDSIVEPDQVSFGVLVMRLAVGLMIFAHGYNHVFRGGKIAGTGRWFESLGMRPGILHAWLASLTELAVGTMLVVGFLTPLAAAGVAGVLTVAWVTNHVMNGFFIFRPGEGWEYVGSITLIAIALGTLGGGERSVDRALDITFHGFDGFFLAMLGPLAAALLLAVFWRPEKVRNAPGVATVFAGFAMLAGVGVALAV